MKRFILILLAAAVIGTTVHAQEVEAPVITIYAQHFAFVPNEITLRRGQTVTLRMTSTDRIRAFRSKELGFSADLRPDQPHDITFTPARAGHFAATAEPFNATLLINVQ